MRSLGFIWGLFIASAVFAQIPKYTTGDECLFCHRVKVADTWQQNPHATTIRPGASGELQVGAGKIARRLKPAGYGKFALLSHDGKTWDNEKFALRCAGCHATAVDPKTREFAAFALDCYACHGVAKEEHPSNVALMRFSSKYPKNPREIVSVCGSCHLRGAASKSSGLPYPNNFVPGDDLFVDYRVDLAQADNRGLNAGDRHIYRNVRDVLESGAALTCLNCHSIHADSAAKHKRVLTSALCEDCHNAEGPKSAVKKYEVHSAVCEY